MDNYEKVSNKAYEKITKWVEYKKVIKYETTTSETKIY